MKTKYSVGDIVKHDDIKWYIKYIASNNKNPEPVYTLVSINSPRHICTVMESTLERGQQDEEN